MCEEAALATQTESGSRGGTASISSAAWAAQSHFRVREATHALRLADCPTDLPCREREVQRVIDYLDCFFARGRKGLHRPSMQAFKFLVVYGPPGTGHQQSSDVWRSSARHPLRRRFIGGTSTLAGKTATVMQAMRRAQELHHHPGIRIVRLNAMSIPSPRQLFQVCLCGESAVCLCGESALLV